MAAIKVFSRFAAFFTPALFFVLFSANHLNAEDYGAAEAYVHSFNNNVTVYSGVFALNKDFSLDTSTYFKYIVDLINPSFGEGGDDGERDGGSLRKGIAAVDAVSGASPAVSSGADSTSDTRHELTAGFAHNIRDIIGIEGYLDYSREKDYSSKTPAITLKKDLFEKNTTLTAGYSRSFDAVSGRFMPGKAERNTGGYFVGVTQVISPVMVAQLGYSRSSADGYMSEGIRLVPVDGASASSCVAESATCIKEVFPDSRSRHAYLFAVNRYFLSGLWGALEKASVKLQLRYYEDDWDISSRTGEVEYNKYLSNKALMRLNYRYYSQAKAFFVKDNYASTDAFLSSSPQLLNFTSSLAGVKLSYNIKEYVPDASFIRGALVEGKYDFYTESTGVNAHIIMAGARIGF